MANYDRIPHCSISIAMATYNGEKYISEQLASLGSQTMLPAELVVTDDNSTDCTFEILEQFAKCSPFPIKIVKNENRLGYKKNFVKAASLCTGDIIAFSDQDDIWEPNKLEVLEYTFRSGSALSITHDFSVLYSDASERLASYFKMLDAAGLSRGANVKGCAMAFRRELSDNFGWPSDMHGWAHDTWIALTSAMVGRRGFISEPLIQHRIHQNNASGWLLTPGTMRKLARRMSLTPSETLEVGDLVNVSVHYRNMHSLVELLDDTRAKGSLAISPHVASLIMRRKRLIEFRHDLRYPQSAWRCANALSLLLSGGYPPGGSMRTFLRDLSGIKRPEGSASL